MLRMASTMLVLMGTGWGIFFAMRGAWLLVALDLTMLCGGIAVAWLMRKQRTLPAFLVAYITIYAVVTGISVVFDIPTVSAPRTSHHFLLVLGFCAQLFLREEKVWLRHSLVALQLLTYGLLASTQWGIPSDFTLPDSIRIGGSWVNTFASLGAIYYLLHIMVSDLSETTGLENALRKGIARKEFFLVYQPQVQFDGTVIGAEALLRWNHPQRGLVSPADFIGLAEHSGLIVPLGLQALETACGQLNEWAQDPQFSKLTLSVNVSAQQFRQPDFLTTVAAILSRTHVRPQALKLELTESLLVQDVDDIIAKMTALQKLGVGFSLDDFGTGFSSLNYLKRLPLDQLKIDQSFVRDVLVDSNDAAIAHTIIELGKNLGFTVIAEGVESEGQRDFLMAHGCSTFQGYLFSKPLPIHAFIDFVRTRNH